MRVVLCHECDVLLTYSSLLHLGHNVFQNVGIPVTPVLHLCVCVCVCVCVGGGGGGAKCEHTFDLCTSPM